jgi:hypothetical protein
MSAIIPDTVNAFAPAQSGRVESVGSYGVGVFRLPTDPLFYASLTLQNIVVGSRYRVTRRDNGQELATGVAASSTVVIAGVPCYANPMLVNITVRNASGTPTYKIFDTSAYISKSGGSAYILQQLDE